MSDDISVVSFLYIVLMTKSRSDVLVTGYLLCVILFF